MYFLIKFETQTSIDKKHKIKKDLFITKSKKKLF